MPMRFLSSFITCLSRKMLIDHLCTNSQSILTHLTEWDASVFNIMVCLTIQSQILCEKNQQNNIQISTCTTIIMYAQGLINNRRVN